MVVWICDGCRAKRKVAASDGIWPFGWLLRYDAKTRATRHLCEVCSPAAQPVETRPRPMEFRP